MATTKRELANQVAQHEAEVTALKTEIANLQEEIQLRTAGSVQLEAEREELRAALALVDRALAQIQQATLTACEEQARAEEITGAAAEQVDAVVYELYARLRFLAASLANILAYEGDDVAVVHAIAGAAGDDVEPFLRAAEATDVFENAFASAIEQVLADRATRVDDEGGPNLPSESDFGLTTDFLAVSEEDLKKILDGMSLYGDACAPDCGCHEAAPAIG